MKKARLALVKTEKPAQSLPLLSTIDLFCGAGGITEGFREAGYQCLYANDSMPEAIETFKHNHSEAWADCRNIEDVKPSEIRGKLKIRKGDLDVLAGGPPCQGFSINAPERFLKDPRNKLFKDYVRFLKEFEPKTFLFENVPGLLSLGDGKVLDRILSEFVRLDYHVTVKILFAAHYGVPQERWRLILLGSKLGKIAPPEPTHYAVYPFGFGLSYTTFEYSNLHTSSDSINPTGEIIVSVDVKNTGTRAGDEVAQMYVKHLDSAVERPIKELRGFQRIPLQPGESRTVKFPLVATGLTYWDLGTQRFVVEPGHVKIMLGSSSADVRLEKRLR
jgi:DNA-cytosine methyltransferase